MKVLFRIKPLGHHAEYEEKEIFMELRDGMLVNSTAPEWACVQDDLIDRIMYSCDHPVKPFITEDGSISGKSIENGIDYISGRVVSKGDIMLFRMGDIEYSAS